MLIDDSLADCCEAIPINDQQSPITEESTIKDRQIFN